MDTTVIERKFEKMGARVKVREARNPSSNDFTIDVRKDKEGPYFDIAVRDEIEMLVLDTQPKDRHLLLMAKDTENRRAEPMKFLCGHDERDWFTCAVPSGPSSVFQAKEALKPTNLRDLESREGLKRKNAQKRHRKLKSGRKIHRQGEFMFTPEPNYQPPSGLAAILKNEPMRRGNGKPHMAEYLYRKGGTTVHVSSYNSKARTAGYTEQEFAALMRGAQAKDAKAYSWSTMRRDPTVYVKGRITHSDHKTLDLGDIWHRVNLNTETRAVGARRVAFLD
jgi:hypothetical protein